MRIVCIFLCFLLVGSQAMKLPSIFIKCKAKDAECLLKSVQDSLKKVQSGVKELGMPSLDPLKVPEVTIGEGQLIQLVQHYTNAEVFGLSTVTVDKFEMDIDKGLMTATVHCPELHMNSSYEVNGKVLMFPVHGKGKNFLSIEKPVANMAVRLEKIKKGDETYVKAVGMDLKVDCESSRVRFDNLFDGNEELGNNINNVINDNWRVLYDETMPAFQKIYSLSLVNLVNKVFLKVPISEMFLDG